MPLFPDNVIQTDFARVHKLIYSFPKTGKTTLAAQMVDSAGRKPLFLMTEEGLGSLPGQTSVRIKSWDGFKRLVSHLEANLPQLQAEHSTVVIDTVGDLDQWCQAWCADQKKVEHVADLDGGKGWTMVRKNIAIEFGKLMGAMPLTFICHSKEKEVLVNGEKIKTQAPSLGAACYEFINAKVEAIMWIDPANSKKSLPRITMRPTCGALAGSRQKAINHDFVYDPSNPAAAYQLICAEYKRAQEQLIAGATVTTNADAIAPVDTKE